MRDRRILGIALAAALGSLFGILQGCGSKFDLPTETRGGRTIPAAQTYQMIDTWHVETTSSKTFDGLNDILLTQGSGSQLFVLFNYGGTSTTFRGEVREYYLTRPHDSGRRFGGGMFNPIAMAVGGNGFGSPASRIFVLDQGDTCLAKFDPDSNKCTPFVVRDLRYAWRVREYGLLGGDTVSTFTHVVRLPEGTREIAWPTLSKGLNLDAVHGIAADDEGNVYVCGVAVKWSGDQGGDPRLTHREFVDRILKFSRGSASPADPEMPGARWHIDASYEIDEGSGTGFVNDPRGMAWNKTGTPGLYVADFGNNSGEKLNDRVSNSGFYRMSSDDVGASLNGPVDVAVDQAGFSYVSDTGNHRVLRYDAFGGFVQRVDIQPDDMGRELVEPVGVAADDSIVYVADRTLKEIVRYQRR